MSIEERGNGYRVRWREGSRNRSRSFDRKADALDFAAAQRRARQIGEAIPPRDGGLELEDMCAEWLAVRKAELAPGTWEDYAYLIELHISPYLGHVPIRHLTPKRIIDWQTERLEDGAGPTSIAKAGVILKAVLGHAEALELVPRNAARVLVRPKQDRSAKLVMPTPAQVEAIRRHFQATGRPGDAALISLIAYAGLRPQEALALRWADVGKRVLHVFAPKTSRHRRVGLEPFVAADLREWELRSDPSGPIFPRARDGAQWRETDYRNWRRRFFRPAAGAAGLLEWDGTAWRGSFRPYELRHFRASYLIALGWSVTDVAAELGHSPETCLQNYAHVFEDRPEGDPAMWIREARKAA